MFEVKISEQIQKLHFNELIKAIKGDGVVSGLEVTAAGGMDLSVSEGAAIINGTLVSFSATSVTVPAADSLYPRKDIVVAKSDGSIEVVQGTPDSPLPSDRTGVFTVTPRPPDPPSGSIILAEIWVPAGATEITSGYITDRRIFTPPRNRGTATITAGNTYVDVPHGLGSAFDISRVQVTPRDDLGGRSFWAEEHPTDPDTYFRIYISSTDTVDHLFNWYAEV